MLTQAKTHDLAVEAVQAAISKGLHEPLMPFTFDIKRHPASSHPKGWQTIYIEMPGYNNADHELLVNGLRNFIRRHLGYTRHCNRCNQEVDDITIWVCPGCGYNEWRLAGEE